jgi:hypothetical protein
MVRARIRLGPPRTGITPGEDDESLRDNPRSLA